MSKLLDILAQMRPGYDFTQSSDFFEEGVLDSFDLVALVADLDKAYGISIDGMDIIPENFNSIAAIEAMLRRNGVFP